MSSLPLAIVFPSGLNTTLLTESVCPIKVLRCSLAWTSHRWRLFPLPPAIVFPSGLNTTLSIGTRSLVIVLRSSRLWVSHTRIPSELPLTNVFPFGLKTTLTAGTGRNSMSSTVSVSHTRIPSAAALINNFPSGLKITLVTGSVCPLTVLSSKPVWGLQSRIVLSRLALAIMFPSGLKATLVKLPNRSGLLKVLLKVSMVSPASTSHKRRILLLDLSPPLASIFPSGLKHTLKVP